MSFFENVKNTMTDVTAKGMQKAQVISESVRINSLISDEENKMNQIYYQIGKLYVSLHSSDAELEFGGMISDLADCEKKISEYREQLQELKGVQRCEKCGAEIQIGMAFCSSCGAPMPKVEPKKVEDGVVCKNCGAVIAHGMRFCTSCGKPMTDLTTASGNVENVIEQKAEDRRCPACGEKLEEGSVFCTSCGAKVS